MSESASVSVAIAIVECHDRFLVGRRGAESVLAGKAEFPGGKIEPGEAASDAARRECQEEAGVSVEVLFEYPATAHTYAHGRVALRFFACRPVGGEVREPLAPFRWVPRAELATLDFPAANHDLLRLLTAEPTAEADQVGSGKRTS